MIQAHFRHAPGAIPSTCSTAILRPRVIGSPPKMAGFTVIHFNRSASSLTRGILRCRPRSASESRVG